MALVLATLLSSSATAQGIITTVAGGGPGKRPARAASLAVYGIAVDSAGHVLVASESGIFRVDSSGQLTSLGDGCGRAVCSALAVAVASSGAIYAADPQGNRVLKIDRNGPSSTVGGDQARTSVPGALAWSVAVDAAGAVYIADAATVAGNGKAGHSSPISSSADCSTTRPAHN